MVSVAHPGFGLTGGQVWPRGRLVTPGVTLPLEASGARSPAVYRRRQLVAAVGAVAVAALLVVLVAGAARLGHATLKHAVTAAERPVVTPGGPVRVHVVQPGETFWSIARQIDPNADPRPLVDRLVAAHGSPALYAGERILLPARG